MDFIEVLLIWVASCFPFFIPLIVPVGSYGFYKHAARHTDGTDDIQSATSGQKGLMTTAHVKSIVGGDGTAGRVLRGIMLSIQDGTNENTLKCATISRWNGDIIASTDNIIKGETVGDFTLSANGKDLKIESSGLTGICLYVISNFYSNSSGVSLTGRATPTANDIQIAVFNATSGISQDLTVLVDTGPIFFHLLYITSA